MNKPKILLVDDRPENLLVLEKSLQSLEADFVSVSNGNDALKEVISNDFALAILDVQMPEMDGYELASLIRSIDNATIVPIVFLSAVHSDDFHIFKGYESGAIDFITKPFTPILLQQKVKIFLDLYNQRCQLQENEKSLTTERQRLAAIITGTNVGTWEWNIQTGEALFNERMAEIRGYTLEELTPNSLENWFTSCHPDDLKRSKALLEDHYNRKTDFFVCEVRLRHKNGEWIWASMRGQVATWETQTTPLLMYGTVQDISTRKQAELAVVTASSRMDTLLSTIPALIYFKDTNLTFISVNTPFATFVGVSPDDMIGKSDLDFFPKAIANKFNADDQKIIESCEPIIDKEEQITDKDGNKIWVLTNKKPIIGKDGKTTGIVGMALDISDLKEAENKLAKALSETQMAHLATKQVQQNLLILNESMKKEVERAKKS